MSARAHSRGGGDNQLLDVNDAAAYLAVTPKFMYRLSSERRIGSVKLGNKLRFRKQDLDAYIEANRRAAVFTS